MAKAISDTKLQAMAPNSLEKREATAAAGKCQMCLTKVPMANQKKLVNDLEAGTVKISKADAEHSHYCGECASKRKSMKENWLGRRDESGGGSKRTKKRAAGKTAKKGKAKTAKKPAAKKAAKKPAAKKAAKKPKGKKAAAKKTADPF